MTIAEKLLARMSTERIKELLEDWSTEAALATTKEHKEVAQRMIGKYRGELERREQNGGSSEGN